MNDPALAIAERAARNAAAVIADAARDLKRLATFSKERGEIVSQADSAGVRRAGACSLELAYVAAGRLDGFWVTSLKRRDLAAGGAACARSRRARRRLCRNRGILEERRSPRGRARRVLRAARGHRRRARLSRRFA